MYTAQSQGASVCVSYIINKSRKSKHRIKNFDINEKNLDLWQDLISNYENEIYEYMCNVLVPLLGVHRYVKSIGVTLYSVSLKSEFWIC